MNDASDTLETRIARLRSHMEDEADRGAALKCFLNDFASDGDFIARSDEENAPQLLAAAIRTVADATGQAPGSPDQPPRQLVLAGHGLHHGNTSISGNIAIYFYLAGIDTGIVGVFPGGDMASASAGRFRLGGPLIHPENN